MNEKEGSGRYVKRVASLVPRSGEKRALAVTLVPLLIILAMLIMEYVPRVKRFEAGKPSTETVIASRDLSVVDEEATEEKREAERQRIKNLFTDRSAQAEAVAGLRDFLEKARALASGEGDLAGKTALLRLQGGQNLDNATLETILTIPEEESPLIYAAAADLLTTVMSEPVSYDNLTERKGEIRARAEELPLSDDMRRAAAESAEAFLTENTAYSEKVIARDMEAAAAAVQTVHYSYTAGQKIVEKGEIITPLTLAALNEAGALSPLGTYQQVFGITLLVLVLHIAAISFMRRYRSEIAAEWRTVAMICLVVTAFSVLCRTCAVLVDNNPIWGYLVPLALVGMILAVLLDRLTALFMVVTGAVLTALFLKGNIHLTLAALLGGLAATFMVAEARSREGLMKSMVAIAAALAVVAMITASLMEDLGFVLLAGALGLASGIVSAIATLGSLPVLERISGLITPMHLQELASPDQPLMKELITKAPGTYSHSVIVGNLANAAALEIGADATLARVGAYYHDIGKIKRSGFFVENQPPGADSHEKIKPNLSALVITAHVREGVDLAREHGLPREIVDIIQQHHGTSLVRFFYARALEESTPDAISESRFRYPGEKPRSKEAAIIMLADAIEAAAKAMDKPNPARLEELARSLIRERLDDGQLGDSNLTMGDLDKIAKAFVRILSAMYHERIEYPALVKEGDVY